MENILSYSFIARSSADHQRLGHASIPHFLEYGSFVFSVCRSLELHLERLGRSRVPFFRWESVQVVFVMVLYFDYLPYAVYSGCLGACDSSISDLYWYTILAL